jgi:hypothetical protein
MNNCSGAEPSLGVERDRALLNAATIRQEVQEAEAFD